MGADGGKGCGGGRGEDPPGGRPAATAKVGLPGGESGGSEKASVGEADRAVAR